MFAAVLMPPPQSYVTFGVIDDAVKVSVVFVQFNGFGVAIFTSGGATLCDTLTEALAVQLFNGSVTVTV